MFSEDLVDDLGIEAYLDDLVVDCPLHVLFVDLAVLVRNLEGVEVVVDVGGLDELHQVHVGVTIGRFAGGEGYHDVHDHLHVLGSGDHARHHHLHATRNLDLGHYSASCTIPPA